MSRTEWIIGIIAGIVISGMVVAFLFLVLDGRNDSPLAEQVYTAEDSRYTPISSMQAHELAEEAAAQWQPDAILVKVNTTWPHGPSRDQLLAGAESWNLGFYSPSAISAANFEVTEDQARMVNEFTPRQPISPDEVDQWRVDSKVAIYRLLDEGGDDFLDDNGISSFTMSLVNDKSRERPEWLLLLLGTQADRTLIMRLDASTGEVLETVRSS